MKFGFRVRQEAYFGITVIGVLLIGAVLFNRPVQAQQEPVDEGESAAVIGPADHEITLETRVVGNKEQPQVLYILPWAAAVPEPLNAGQLRRHHHGVYDHQALPGVNAGDKTADRFTVSASASR